MSFAISPSAKPELNFPFRMNCANLFSVLLLRPVEALITLISVCGSMPKRSATSTASAAAARPAAET